FADCGAARRNHSRPHDAEDGRVRVYGRTARTAGLEGSSGRGHNREGPHAGGHGPPQWRRRARHPKERPRRDAASAQSRDRQVRQAPDHGGCMKILYVEDNDDNVYMLKNRLTRAGFTVLIATDGAQGIAMAASEQPDLILMDLTLPNIDGEEATRRIKADPVTRSIPVIALTANAMPEDREKALPAGCEHFDTKPVELPRLLEKIRALAPAGSAP